MKVGVMPFTKVEPSDTKASVEVKCIFVRINQIDTVRENYFADVFIQAKWREPKLDDKKANVDLKTLWNPKIFVENSFSELKESVSLHVIYEDYDSRAYILEKRRIKGIFRETLELKQFPFDCQDLSVVISTGIPCEEIDLVESLTDISKLNIESVLDSQEWNLYNHVEVSLDYILSDADIGPKKRQIITFTCRASRRFKYFIINHLMISSMLSFLAFCSFAINVSITFSRLQLCVVNLLTTVTFKVALSSNLPKISYLTYLDKALLANLCVIMSLCFWHAGTSIFFNNIITDGSSGHALATANMVAHIQLIERILIPVLLGIYVSGIIIYGISIYFDAGSRRREMELKDIEFEKKLEELKLDKASADV